MHTIFLVEEPSVEAALGGLLPKILGDEHGFEIIVHQGKTDLLDKLPTKLRSYRSWLPEDYRIVVLVDEDRQDCHELKARLEEIAREAGFPTKASPRNDGSFTVLNRIAVEELEAWFFGDVHALVEAFPRVPSTLGKKAPYRDPDAIAGGTWEALERILQRAGHFPAGLPKIEAARQIARRMEPGRNRSHSFQVFCQGLRELG
jgi:hypothetical protein